jgi:UDPglucose--hexose-1-phosphate uridylyltransferase
MGARIQFESFQESLEILNPFKGFEKEVQTVQLRRDPLLGHVSIYNPLLQGKAKVFFGDIDWDLVQRLAAESASTCVFCPHRSHQVARYPDDLVPGGQIQVGAARLFPNLFSLAKHHAVVALSEAHFLKLSELTPELLSDALAAVHRFVERVYSRDNAAYLSVNANYLFPAGASLMHPHLQVLMSTQPYTHHAQLTSACLAYFRAHSESYHAVLIEEERALGARYIAQTGRWHWLAAYSPLGSHEIIAAHESEGDFGRLGLDDVRGLAQGISAVLRLLESLGYLSFNLSLYSVRAEAAPQGFNCLLRLIHRQNPYPNYRSDDYFLQKLLQAELIVDLPEHLSECARSYFPA